MLEKTNLANQDQQTTPLERFTQLSPQWHRARLKTQRRLIGFLVSKMMKIRPVPENHFKYEEIVSFLVSSLYNKWFDQNVLPLANNSTYQIDLKEFLQLFFRGKQGPRKMFKTLFPDQKLLPFLNAHLDDIPPIYPIVEIVCQTHRSTNQQIPDPSSLDLTN